MGNKRNGMRDQSIEVALEYLFKKEQSQASIEDELSYGERKEMEGFREAQELKRREQLDDEAEGGSSANQQATSSSSSSAAAPSVASANSVSARESAIAAAVAER